MTPLSRYSRRRVFHFMAAGAMSLTGAHRFLPAAAVDAIDYCPSAEERAFLTRINEFRSTHGLGPLRLSRTLGAASRHHSEDMAARNYFDHQTPEGDSPGERAVAHGYPSSSVGENIAAGNESAAATFGQWESSSGHRDNMLGSNYQAIGIGRAQGGSYRWYWTTVFGRTFDAAPLCDGGTNPPPPPPTPTPRPPTPTPTPTATPRPPTPTPRPPTRTPVPPTLTLTPTPPAALVDPIPGASKDKKDKKHKKHKKHRHSGNNKGHGKPHRHRR